MLKVNVNFEKDAVSPKNKNGAMLLEINMEKGKKAKTNRKKLNLSLSIDVSMSMAEALVKQKYNYQNPARIFAGDQLNNFFIANNQFVKEVPAINNVTKLAQAKKMAIKIVEELQDGDILSLTTFSEVGKVIQEAKVINETNKALILSKINSLAVEGNTNLYDGWELSARELAKYVSNKTLNRVILLTDGVVNKGLRGQEITSRVEAMTKANIQTTTFGIGEGFQEDLLSDIAEKGEGNFFFVEKDEDFSAMLNIEMSGLTDATLTNVEVLIKSDNAIFKQLNGFKEDSNIIKLPNLRGSKKTELILEFELFDKVSFAKKKTKGFTKINLGAVEISGLDVNGNKVTYKEEVSIQQVSDEDWSLLAANGDIVLKKVMLNVALEQQKASDLILKGRVNEARTLMASSVQMLKDDYGTSEIATAMANNIEESLLKDNNAMSKSIRSTSYSSRYGFSNELDEKLN